MKFGSRYFVMLGAGSVLVLAFTGCLRRQSDEAASTRPACVTLSSYSSVIEQVMDVQPSWDPLAQIEDGYQYQWTIQDDQGKHTLSATLTSDGCVCATGATSHFHVGEGQDELVGLLQGAAVAPVSDLDYTARWLEPRILLPCAFAFAFHRSYEAETLMKDATTWKLICSRSQSAEVDELLTTLTIIAPSCVDLLD